MENANNAQPIGLLARELVLPLNLWLPDAKPLQLPPEMLPLMPNVLNVIPLEDSLNKLTQPELVLFAQPDAKPVPPLPVLNAGMDIT